MDPAVYNWYAQTYGQGSADIARTNWSAYVQSGYAQSVADRR